jgi:hypothetical protein
MSFNPLAWSDDIWLALDRLSILAGNLMFLFAVGGGLWGFFKRDDIRRWFSRNRFPHVGAELAREQHWDALAFTVSHKELPIWVIDTCRPAHLGLIATEQSRTVAEEIAGLARQKGIQVQNPVYLENPDDPAEALVQTRQVLARLRETGAEKIAVDITGGKTPMSLGAFMAAEEMGASTLYVSCGFDAKLNKPDTRSATVIRISRPE